MDILTEFQKNKRQELIDFANTHVNPKITERDKDSIFDRQLWNDCSQLGLHGLILNAELKGNSYNLSDTLSIVESMGFAFKDNGLSFGITAQLMSTSYLIDKYGLFQDHKNLLSKVINGEVIIAHAITEKTSGSDAFSMSSTYSKNRDSIKLNIDKTYCSNLPVADYVLCYANNEIDLKFTSAFILPTLELGDIVSIDKMGLNTCIMGRAEQRNIKTNANSILGKENEGKPYFNDGITMERLGMSALHLGTVERLLKEVITWVKDRQSNNKKLSEYQAITHKLVEIYETWNVLRVYMYQISNSGLSFSKLYLESSILKHRVAKLYVMATQSILQMYGGLGYTKDCDIERMHRDAIASKIYSGTSEILKEIVWKYIK